MTQETPPCQQAGRDPDDWFIERYGRQYREDTLLTLADAAKVIEENFGTEEFSEEQALEVLEAAEAEAVRKALIRRRQARASCYECPIRTSCLHNALTSRIQHGTWGGYYPEERQKVLRGLDARRRELPLIEE